MKILIIIIFISNSLLSYDPTPSIISYPLHKAAELGCNGLIRHYINSGDYEINSSDEFNRTPLHWAVIMGNRRTVEILLELDAEVIVRDGTGKLPEHYAKNKEIRKMLQEWRKLEIARLKKD